MRIAAGKMALSVNFLFASGAFLVTGCVSDDAWVIYTPMASVGRPGPTKGPIEQYETERPPRPFRTVGLFEGMFCDDDPRIGCGFYRGPPKLSILNTFRKRAGELGLDGIYDVRCGDWNTKAWNRCDAKGFVYEGSP